MTYGLGDDMEDLQRENAKLREELQAARDNMAANMGLAANLRDDLEAANLQIGELEKANIQWKRCVIERNAAERLIEAMRLKMEDDRGHSSSCDCIRKLFEKRSPGTQNCIDCGKPVSSGNICMPCVRVRYPSGSTPTFKSNCKCTEAFTRNGVCTRCGFPV